MKVNEWRGEQERDTVVTIRVPAEVVDFLDKYVMVKGTSKKAIMENSVLDLLKTFFETNVLGVYVTDDVKRMVKENVQKKVPATSVTRGEKVVIYVNKEIDDIVQAVSETVQIKPTDIYRMALIRFFNLHRHEDLGEGSKTRDEKLTELLEDIFSRF